MTYPREQPLTLAHALWQAQHVDPDRGFHFVKPGGNPSYLPFSQLAARAYRLAKALETRGVVKGQVVGLVLSDPQTFVLAFFGALLLGAIPTPIYPPFSVTELAGYLPHARGILAAAEASLVIVDDGLTSLFSSSAASVPAVGAGDLFAPDTDPPEGPLAASSFPPPAHVAPEDTAFLQFTSGSTDRPKGVIVSHANLVANILEIHHSLRMTPDTKPGCWLPLYHDMGLIGFVLLPLYCQLSAVLMATASFLKRPTCWLETVAQHKVTITFAPNFAFALAVRVTKNPESLDLSHVSVIGCAAEPIHADTLWTFTEHFSRAGLHPRAVAPSYGMAEATLAISFDDLDRAPRRERVDAELYRTERRALPTDSSLGIEFVACGKVIEQHELWIADSEGRKLPDRQVGEIMFRGPSVAQGYKNHPEASQSSFTPWGLRTGDLGYSVDGDLFVTGRKKDLLIVNGRNYDPATIEFVVAGIDGIRAGSVIAFSVPGRITEEVVIVAEARSGGPALLEQIKGLVWQRLQLRVSDVLIAAPKTVPKTTSGKLRRSAARDLYLNDRQTYREKTA